LDYTLINCIIDNIEKLIKDENANFAIQKIIKLNKKYTIIKYIIIYKIK